MLTNKFSSNLTMYHSPVHNSSHDALPVFAQLEGDAHRLVRVSLELNEPDPSDVLDLRHAVAVRTLEAASDAAVVQERGKPGGNGTRGWRGHPNRVFTVDFVGNDIVALKSHIGLILKCNIEK